MPSMTSSMNATVSGQASRRFDQICAANATLTAFPLDYRKCALLFRPRPSIPEKVH